MKSSNISYIPGLDHLRSFAILLIVFYHGLHTLSFLPRSVSEAHFNSFWIYSWNPFVALIEEGHTAVALFMVLSGFVFEVGAYGREVLYGAFVKNRFLRIYPLFVVLLMLGATARPANYSFIGMMQTLTFQASFPGALALEPFSGMFWAIAVEFQFYLIFPFLHRFIERDGAKWALGLIVLAIFFRYAARLGLSNPRDISYWHITGRIDQFLIGMMAARWHRSRKTPPANRAPFFGALLLVSTTVVAFNQMGGYPSTAGWKIFWPTIEGAVWAVFLVTYIPVGARLPALLSRPLAFVGTLSYSMYLLHFLFLKLFPTIISYRFPVDLNLQSQLFTAVFIIIPLIAVSALSYYVIERPFLEMRVKYLK